MKCDKTVINPKGPGLGRCGSKTDNAGPLMNIVDYRVHVADKQLHPEVNQAANQHFQKAMNFQPSTSRFYIPGAGDIPDNSAYIYLWAKHRSNPGHAAIMFNKTADVKYVSHWPDDFRQCPRYEIDGEHKLPDVIYRLDNLVWDEAKFRVNYRVARTSEYE